MIIQPFGGVAQGRAGRKAVCRKVRFLASSTIIAVVDFIAGWILWVFYRNRNFRENE